MQLVISPRKAGKVKYAKDEDFGFYEEGSITINIEKIFKHVKTEQKFINQFSKIVLHETLHSVFDGLVSDEFLVGEEKLIRSICKEPWTKKIEKEYKSDLATAR